MRPKTNGHKVKSQPRLKNFRRIPKYSGLHPVVKMGLDKIAKSEGKSVSWVIHQIIAEFFGRDIMGDKV